jgi:hypothetical protein
MENFCAMQSFKNQGLNSRAEAVGRELAGLPRARDFSSISFRASPAPIHTQTRVHIYTGAFLFFRIEVTEGKSFRAIQSKFPSTFPFTNSRGVRASKPSS